jgi:small-conductance mechanosensitive channel
MGGIRGGVIALGFMQTTVMEVGQLAAVQCADPAMWVRGRQYTGRIVTITNDKIFDEPVYNYSREFPFLWEEMTIPVPYGADRARVENILLEIARAHTVKLNELSEEAIKELERRYVIRRADLGPRVYYRLTDNWLEMSLRFITEDSGIREVKDAISRRSFMPWMRQGSESPPGLTTLLACQRCMWLSVIRGRRVTGGRAGGRTATVVSAVRAR